MGDVEILLVKHETFVFTLRATEEKSEGLCKDYTGG